MLTSQIVQNLEMQKRLLKEHIRAEEQKIRFLETEWAYLNRPDRLEKLVVDLQLLEELQAHPQANPNVIAMDQPVPEPMRPARPHKKPVFVRMDGNHQVNPGSFNSQGDHRLSPEKRSVRKDADKSFYRMIDQLNEQNAKGNR